MTSLQERDSISLLNQNLDDFSSAVRRRTDAYILDQLSFSSPDARTQLTDCMQHAVRAGGKRIRPILVILAHALLDSDIEKIIPLAAAIEMIHTYSLIHDDLPAMDNDDLRRGLPTCHVAFDEATAILAGDTLNTFAFELLARKLPDAFPPAHCLAALVAFAEACGVNGMAGGQILDLTSEGKSFDAAHLKHIHALKTGALIRVCFTMPGILSGANTETMGHLSALGEAMGLLFQMVDDLLDEIGDAAALGKAVQKDSKLQKVTYISIYGLTGTQEKIKEQATLAYDLLRPFEGKPSELLHDMITYLAKRDT